MTMPTHILLRDSLVHNSVECAVPFAVIIVSASCPTIEGCLSLHPLLDILIQVVIGDVTLA